MVVHGGRCEAGKRASHMHGALSWWPVKCTAMPTCHERVGANNSNWPALGTPAECCTAAVPTDMCGALCTTFLCQRLPGDEAFGVGVQHVKHLLEAFQLLTRK